MRKPRKGDHLVGTGIIDSSMVVELRTRVSRHELKPSRRASHVVGVFEHPGIPEETTEVSTTSFTRWP